MCGRQMTAQQLLVTYRAHTWKMVDEGLDDAKQRREILRQTIDVLEQIEPSIEPSEGDFALVTISESDASLDYYAPQGSDLAYAFELVSEQRLSFAFPRACLAEVDAIWDNGLESDGLRDYTKLPFVTVDGEGTRDLDQALFLTQRSDEAFTEVVDTLGVEVAQNTDIMACYAIADASYFVRIGSALFEEALRRGTSIYFADLSIPMLPRRLSEGLISLNEGQLRRSTCFIMQLDHAGNCLHTDIVLALIRSQAKLTNAQVAHFLEHESQDTGNVSHHLSSEDVIVNRPFANSIRVFQRFGDLRMLEAKRRNVVQFQRVNLDVGLDPLNATFVPQLDARTRVDRYNEQFSLLCNMEGARILREKSVENGEIKAIFRNHAAPSEHALCELEQMIDAMIEHQDLPALWRWDRHTTRLSDYLTALPSPKSGRYYRIRQAIERQILMMQRRSTFSQKAGLHSALGVNPYARLSAPMREVVGVFTHHELVSALGLACHDQGELPNEGDAPRGLRDRVIDAANRARERQRRIDKEIASHVIDDLLKSDVSVPLLNRPTHVATVLGMKASALYVRLDTVPLDLKIYIDDIADLIGEGLQYDAQKTCLSTQSGRKLFVIGDAMEVRVSKRDEKKHRWRVLPVMK